MRHVVVSRFSVPRLETATASRHDDRAWLAGRLDLFRRYFVPSVERLGVPVVLLCSTESVELVSGRLDDLTWVRTVVQDSWHGGWAGGPDELVTRLDSDDALHADWFAALEEAPLGFEVYCTRRFLRLDQARGALYAYSRREPSPLAAFRPGLNPYAHDHKVLEHHYKVTFLRPAYLLQVVHGGNVSSRRPRWWRWYLRVSRERLRPFGIEPAADL